jgi:hypothetical protein
MHLSKRRVLTISLIAIGILTVGFFGLRTARAIRQFQGHPPLPPSATEHVETDVELIRDWMTVPFVSKMYHVRQHILFDSLGIPEQGNREKSLKQLNEEYYPASEGIVLEKIKAAILANQSQQIHTNPNTPIVP